MTELTGKSEAPAEGFSPDSVLAEALREYVRTMQMLRDLGSIPIDGGDFEKKVEERTEQFRNLLRVKEQWRILIRKSLYVFSIPDHESIRI